MLQAQRIIRRVTAAALAALVALAWAGVAAACPTCKDNLSENYVWAYGLSIVFMMSMPFLILGSLVLYMYYLVRKARAQGSPPSQQPAVYGASCGARGSQNWSSPSHSERA